MRGTKRSLGILLAALLGVGTGCSALHSRKAASLQPGNVSSAQHLLAVPFFPDDTDQCGPSALASVLSFWHSNADPATLKEEIYLAHLKGSLPIDLLLAAQKRGFSAQLYSGTIDGLKSELDKGHPLIAFLNRGFAFAPVGHYVVVNGYDDARQGLYVHSGLAENQFVSFRHFMKEWKKTERSTLLILPPDKIQDTGHAGV